MFFIFFQTVLISISIEIAEMVSHIAEQYKHRDAHPSTSKKKTKKGKEGWALFSKLKWWGVGHGRPTYDLLQNGGPAMKVVVVGLLRDFRSKQLPARSLSLRWRPYGTRHFWSDGAGDFQGRNFRTLRCGCWFSKHFVRFGILERSYLDQLHFWRANHLEGIRRVGSHGAGVPSTATAALTNVSSQLCAAQ